MVLHMGKAKDIIIQKNTKGRDGKITQSTTKLGDLSKNELCRGIDSLQRENQELKISLNNIYYGYANHLASIDAMSKEEGMSLL